MKKTLHSQVLNIMVFVGKFVAACAALFILINIVPKTWFEPLNIVTADLLGLFLGLTGFSPSVNGVLVTAGGFSVKIITECSAIFVAILFLCFVFAYPVSLRHKIVGCITGVFFLFAVNLLRLLSIFLIGMKNPVLFH